MNRPRLTPKWTRRLLGGSTALVLVAGGAAGGIWWSNRASASSAGGATVQTQLVAASLGTVRQTVSATGTIEPATQATLSFTSTGTVGTVDVAVGDKVAKGDTVATLDPTALQQSVTLAQAGLTAAQSQVATAAAGSAAASAAAQLASAKQQLSSAEQALAGATLSSPISGVVASVGITAGTTAGSSSSGSGSSSSSGSGSGASGSSSGSAGAASSSSSSIVIVNTSGWLVNATVASNDLAQLKKGLQATITTTGSRQPIFGTVQSVGIVASSSSSGTAQFPVVIAVTGNPAGTYAGTAADVAITVKQLNDVLTVPTLAIHSTNGQTTVQVSRNGVVTPTPVTIGGVYGATTQITKGISTGDQVVVQVRTSSGTGTTGGTTGGTGGTGRGGLGGGFGGGGFGGGGFGGGGGGGRGTGAGTGSAGAGAGSGNG